jgi:hypothetical protein
MKVGVSRYIGTNGFDIVGGSTFPYEPPPTGGQPITTAYLVQSDVTTKLGRGAQYTYSVSFQIQTGLILNSVSVANTYTTTDSWNSTVTSTATNAANLSITGPATSDNYTGPTEFQVWRDNVYGSFMFYPVQ